LRAFARGGGPSIAKRETFHETKLGANPMSKNLRELMARKADQAKSMRSILDKASAEKRSLTSEEETQLVAGREALRAINAQIEIEQELEAAETGAAASSRRTEGNELVDEDPRRGFRSLGEFAQCVRAAATPGMMQDQRLRASVPSTASSEAAGADGAFAVPPEFAAEIWRLSLGEGSLVPLTQNTVVSGNSMAFPKDETTPWGGTGAQAYWRAELAALTGSKLVLGVNALRLHELIVLLPVTNELLDDAPALGSYLQPLAAERVQWKSNESILFGTGVGQPKGCLAAANKALVVQAKDSGQTGGITNTNLANMVSRLKVGELMNAIWLANPDVLPALEAMTVGNYPIYLPNMNAADPSYGRVKGRPLQLSEHANALNAQSDISLLSLKGYRTITKAGGIETASSMHIYFDANATAFRFIYRIDGQPIMTAPITPPTGKSSNTRSYFVTLAARP
jgi:HK97 family phage major capsid protein